MYFINKSSPESFDEEPIGIELPPLKGLAAYEAEYRGQKIDREHILRTKADFEGKLQILNERIEACMAQGLTPDKIKDHTKDLLARMEMEDKLTMVNEALKEFDSKNQ